MVFEPTFEQIDKDAASLPDLKGAAPEIGEEPGGVLGDGEQPLTDDEQDGAAEAIADTALAAGAVAEDDLPPYGEE